MDIIVSKRRIPPQSLRIGGEAKGRGVNARKTLFAILCPEQATAEKKALTAYLQSLQSSFHRLFSKKKRCKNKPFLMSLRILTPLRSDNRM
jgi:hypothetical protein